ncbi:DUF2239 family protein [Caulobacter henricii]|uniref:DUF2239 family protein n=1 Tax=Caulobacter henricii TaxID=69395 RepID=A0A0N7JHN6_9CAUL|nr:DUF2239 family protein [Caulobacter henricii]ALL13898.1 hypothetical protein AQ619_11440 [Caulobacter henricii]
MSHVVFRGDEQIAAGTALEVALVAQRLSGEDSGPPVLIFDAEGRQVDFDLRGGPGDLAARFATVEEPVVARGRGRPKLGVAAREVTLLPRHWAWLATQPGGASVTLRKLVEAASRGSAGPDRMRQAREATYRFATVMAGDREGFEAAMRALFAGDPTAFEARISAWPDDILRQVRRFAGEAFETAPPG